MLNSQYVEQIMNPSPVAVFGDITVNDTLNLMNNIELDCIVILKTKHHNCYRTIGLITREDIVQFQQERLDLDRIEVEMVMRECQSFVWIEDSLEIAKQKMERARVNYLVVIGDSGELIGTISYSSILSRLFNLNLDKN